MVIHRPHPGLTLLLAVASCCALARVPGWLFAALPSESTRVGAISNALASKSASKTNVFNLNAKNAAIRPHRNPAWVLGSAFVAAATVTLSLRHAIQSDAAVRPANSDARADRAKGSQVLPLGAGLQRFFSIRNRQFWDYTVNPRTYWGRQWMRKDYMYGAFLGAIHLGSLAAPFYFTRKAFMCFLAGYLITALGITLSYHRQLAHRAFKTPKWLEYVFAYSGVLSLQGHPINWVSSHRHHHGGTETENDVHSPLDGFWWSHAGWLLDKKGTWMRANKANATDLSSQLYYRYLEKTYIFHAIVFPIAGLYAYGGLPCVLWGFFARVVWVWHVTWAVNSVSHCWGFKDWNTSCNSMNNWLIGMLALGEGWHNNHHAFETSCRHGLKWWQLDLTWGVIKTLELFGLAWDLKYPSETRMKKLQFPSEFPISAEGGLDQ